MKVNDDNQLVCTRLEEKVLDVAKENIDIVSAVISVSKTVLMDLYFTRNALAI